MSLGFKIRTNIGISKYKVGRNRVTLGILDQYSTSHSLYHASFIANITLNCITMLLPSILVLAFILLHLLSTATAQINLISTNEEVFQYSDGRISVNQTAEFFLSQDQSGGRVKVGNT